MFSEKWGLTASTAPIYLNMRWHLRPAECGKWYGDSKAIRSHLWLLGRGSSGAGMILRELGLGGHTRHILDLEPLSSLHGRAQLHQQADHKQQSWTDPTWCVGPWRPGDMSSPVCTSCLLCGAPLQLCTCPGQPRQDTRP